MHARPVRIRKSLARPLKAHNATAGPGVCGDLDFSYQYPHSQGTEDPRVIYNKYDQYFYNFAYGKMC